MEMMGQGSDESKRDKETNSMMEVERGKAERCTNFEGEGTSSSSSSLGSRCVPWLGEGLLPYRVAPVFVQVVSLSLGWSLLSSFLVMVSKW